MEAGERADGRGLEEFRNVFLKTKVISQAKGSAYVEFGTTKVMVGIYGPRQSERKFGFVDTGRLECDVRLTSFAAANLPKQAQTSQEKDLTAAVHQALQASIMLDKFPKAVVDLYAMVLESGGSDAAATITAASLALADAGVEMFDLVPACQIGKLEGSLLLDTSSQEEKQQDGSLLLAAMLSRNEMTQMSMSGQWSSTELREAVELGLGACGQLRMLMREALISAVSQPKQ